jgi:hypothetical protein
VGLQQPQRLGHEVGPLLPRRGAHSGDLTGADGLSVLLVLSVSQRAEHDALLGSHRQRNLATEPPCSVIWVRAPSAPWMSMLRTVLGDDPSTMIVWGCSMMCSRPT